jgi:hypothetical protein
MTHAARYAVVRRRQWIAALTTVSALLLFGLTLGHAGQHMLRSLLVPGAGLYDQHLLLGLACTVAFVVAIVGWLRWGTDWAVAGVTTLAVVGSGLLANSHHGEALVVPTPQVAAHEFPLVVIVVGMLGWLRVVVRRTPLLRRWHARVTREREGIDDLGTLAPVDRCRAAAIAALAGGWPAGTEQRIVAAIEAPDVVARARRIGSVARGRFGGDPFRRDHAAARAALSLWGRLDDAATHGLVADADRSWLGVPSSEPGWVRLVDGTLAALALHRHDPSQRPTWADTLHGSMALHRGHRPASAWTPLGFHLGRAEEWEHVTATALARAAGWIGDDDWTALRRRALGAAARGAGHPSDERTIAAARIWVAFVDDEEAARVLARPTVRRDPLAVALDAYAARLGADRDRTVATTLSTGAGT